MEFMRGLKNNSFELTVSDIPYDAVNRKSNGLRNLDKKDADIKTFNAVDFTNEVCRVTKGSVYVFCGWGQISEIQQTMINNGMSVRVCVWEKTNPSPMNGDKIWLSGVEFCVYGKFPKATFNCHCKNAVFRFPTVRSKIHPTEKPVKLLEYIIAASSNEGDTVFDPCFGSGSCCEASLNLGRNFVGTELNEQYFKAAKERIENHKFYQQELIAEGE
jgi:DNA modification methylase